MKGFIGARQTTLASEISITGTGVHSGAPVSIILYPADGDTGLRFLLSNGDSESTEITADQRYVTGVTLCTVLGDGNGASVACRDSDGASCVASPIPWPRPWP